MSRSLSVLLLLAWAATALSRSDPRTDMMEVSGDMSSHQGRGGGMLVTATDPMMANAPAYRFQGRGVCLDEVMSRKVVSFVNGQCVSGQCFAISMYVRVEKKQATGTVLSVRCAGNTVLDIVFKRNVQMRIRHFNSHSRVQWDRLYYEFELGQWYHIILTICPQTGLVTLHVDCNQIYQRSMDWGCVDCREGSLEVCVGKLANNESDQPPFWGSIQRLQLYRGNNAVRLLCGTTCAFNRPREVFLQGVIQGLRRELTECRKRFCVVNNVTYGNGQRVPVKRLCTRECTCRDGQISCTPQSCPDVPCLPERLIPADPSRGVCCSLCRIVPQARRNRITIEPPTTTPPPGSCRFNGIMYPDGKTGIFKPNDQRQCFPCTCRTGRVMCRPLACRPLSCAPVQQYQPPNRCCPICLDHNICRSNPCGPHARCINKPNRSHECICNRGATMNARTRRCERPVLDWPFAWSG